jgi:hypothetical protein
MRSRWMVLEGGVALGPGGGYEEQVDGGLGLGGGVEQVRSMGGLCWHASALLQGSVAVALQTWFLWRCNAVAVCTALAAVAGPDNAAGGGGHHSLTLVLGLHQQLSVQIGADPQRGWRGGGGSLQL